MPADYSFVNTAVATPLEVYPLSTATAFTVVVAERVKYPVYWAELAVGVVPLVV